MSLLAGNTMNTIRFLILLASLVYSIPFSKTTRGLYRHAYPDKKNPATSSPLFSRRHLGAAFIEARLTRRLLTCAFISAHVNEVAVAPCPPASVESTHLKLGSQAMLKRVEEEEEDTTTTKGEEETPQVNNTKSVLHTYHDPIQNVTLCGVNVSKRKFQSWLAHTLEPDNYNASFLSTKHVQLDDMTVRQALRTLWRQERLLTDRTEVLAIYPSEVNGASKKGGGFPDLLHIYAERLFYIIQDELEEEQMTQQVPQDIQEILKGGLYGWLEREYEGTDKLCHETMQHLTAEQQHAIFQHFLEWFRSRFPYYYDRCDTCGASAKDEPVIENEQDDMMCIKEEEDEEEDDNGTFLGYVYPSKQELLGKASRTEIYQCHNCGSFTRFPRYNSASSIIRNKRGRCGEYSMLLYRILRATGHTCRWIVDWADHVWAEVRLNGHWIHLDPCEAAVNKPLLYEEWGKQQTYIVAFHAPLKTIEGTSILSSHKRETVPLIEDVTLRYTSSDQETIRKRRDESEEELQTFMERTILDLKRKLDGIL